MTPRAFSFNSPHGACPECQGLGAVYDFDPARVVPDDIAVARRTARSRRGRSGDERLIDEMLAGLQRTFGIDLDVPFGKLPKKLRDIVLLRRPRGRAKRADRTRVRPKPRRSRRGAARRSVRRRLRRRDPEPAPAVRGRHLDGSGERSSRTARCGRARRATATRLRPREPRRAREGAHAGGIRATCRSAEALPLVRVARADRARAR